MTATKNSSLEIILPSDREIVMTRIFDAPRDLVFEAMTKAEHVKRWWGPCHLTAEVCEIDFRVGGKWRYLLHAPDGKKVEFTGVYREILAPERIVATERYVEPSLGNPEWLSTLTLEDLGEKTKLTNRVLHPNKEQRDGHVNSGMESGAAETYDRLNEIVTAQATMMERSIEIVRIFDAPRELVYEAWTDPEHMTQWWGPKVFTNHSCKLDVRPGGTWQIVMRSPDGTDYGCKGIYSEVKPSERLVFTNDAVDRDDKPLLKGFTTVTFETHPGNKTKLTLQTRAQGLVDFAPQMLKGMDQGWSQSFDKLSAHVDPRL
jgi:uncharacterized protein YndB with AHSA1/START domain